MSQTEVSAREFSAAPYEADGEPLGLADVPSGPVPMNGADEGRLRTMVDVHFDFIWRSLRRLGVPPNDVDDAAQQVFWIAAKNLQRIETRSERSYLFGTALRVASDARTPSGARARGERRRVARLGPRTRRRVPTSCSIRKGPRDSSTSCSTHADGPANHAHPRRRRRAHRHRGRAAFGDSEGTVSHARRAPRGTRARRRATEEAKRQTWRFGR